MQGLLINLSDAPCCLPWEIVNVENENKPMTDHTLVIRW